MPTSDYTDFDTTEYPAKRGGLKKKSTFGSFGAGGKSKRSSFFPATPNMFGRRSSGGEVGESSYGGGFLPSPGQGPYSSYLTDTTTQEQKEEEAAKRMAIIEAFKELYDGKLPSNEQLCKWICKIKCSDIVREQRGLSKDGRQMMDALGNLLTTLQQVIDEKNGDEDIQQFLFHARLATQSAGIVPQTEKVSGGVRMDPLSTQQITKQITTIGAKLITIMKLLLTSSDFRTLLRDLNDLFQDSFADFVHETTAPSEPGAPKGLFSRRRSISGGAQQEEERDKSSTAKRSRARTESTEFEAFEKFGQPVGRGRHSIAEGEAAIPLSEKSITVDKQPSSQERESMETPPVASTSTQRPSTSDAPFEAFGISIPSKRSKEDAREKETSEGMITSILPSSAPPAVVKMAQVFEDKLTPDRRERLAERIRNVMYGLQADSEYKDALEGLLGIIKEFAESSNYVADRITGERVRTDANVKVAREEFKIVLESFANEESLDPLMESIYRFDNHMKQDFHLRNYMHDLRAFTVKSLKEKSYLDDEDYPQRGAELIRRGRQLLGESYRDDTSNLLGEVDNFLRALQSDPLTRKLQSDILQLNRSMFLDSQGNYALKTGLLNDFTRIILPDVARAVKFVPIPRIEHQDENYHVVMTDIIVTTANLVPNILELAAKNRAVLSLQNPAVPSFLTHSMTMNFYQMHINIQDVPFYFKKKTGFPHISDYGVASLRVAGQGICAFIKLGLDKNSTRRTLIPRRIQVIIDDLDLHLYGTARDGVYQAMKPVINGILRQQLTNALEEQLRYAIGSADLYMTKMKIHYMAKPAAETRRGVPGGGTKATWKRVLKSVGVRPAKAEEEEPKKKWFERRASYQRESMLQPEREQVIETRKAKRLTAARAPWTSSKFDLGHASSSAA